MEKEITTFITYLHNVKGTSKNTEMSYKRDLDKVRHFMAERGICEVSAVSSQDLGDYVKYLEDNKFAAATVSRNIASLKAFYHFMLQEGCVAEDLSEQLKAPKIEKKVPEIMSPEEVIRLLEQPTGDTPKEIRDKAMLEPQGADHSFRGGGQKCAGQISGRHEGRHAGEQDFGCPLCQLFRAAHEQAGFLEADQILCEEGRDQSRYHTAHAAPFFCGPSGGEWCRPQERTGDAGALGYFHDPDLCEYESQSYQRGVCEGAPKRVDK